MGEYGKKNNNTGRGRLPNYRRKHRAAPHPHGRNGNVQVVAQNNQLPPPVPPQVPLPVHPPRPMNYLNAAMRPAILPHQPRVLVRGRLGREPANRVAVGGRPGELPPVLQDNRNPAVATTGIRAIGNLRNAAVRIREGPPIPERPKYEKTTICEFDRDQGYCKFGNQCTYAHGDSDLRPNRPPISVTNFKVKVCVEFENTGQCKYGARCYDLHDEKVRNRCSLFWATGRCYYGGDICPFPHKSNPNLS